jgi:hypothetical protein
LSVIILSFAVSLCWTVARNYTAYFPKHQTIKRVTKGGQKGRTRSSKVLKFESAKVVEVREFFVLPELSALAALSDELKLDTWQRRLPIIPMMPV